MQDSGEVSSPVLQWDDLVVLWDKVAVSKAGQPSVLVSGRVELTFFMVAGMGL